MNANDPDLEQRAHDADDYYQDIVVEDAASMPDGCLGVIGIVFVVGIIAKLLL